MGTLNEDLASIKEVEDTITANKVANFAYTDKAYTDNDANGVIEYDVSKEQNIPSSDASILKVNETVLWKGYRAQASSVTRMLLNHFFGRVSYNLNKVNDCVSSLVATLRSHLGKANGIATLDNEGHIPYSQLPESAVEYKGNWNADTNTPQLVDGTGNLGDLYIVSVAGRQDLGSGEVNYLVGDRIIYNQNNIWEKLSGGSVRSVENQLPDASGNISLPVIDELTVKIEQSQTKISTLETKVDSLYEHTVAFKLNSDFDSSFVIFSLTYLSKYKPKIQAKEDFLASLPKKILLTVSGQLYYVDEDTSETAFYPLVELKYMETGQLYFRYVDTSNKKFNNYSIEPDYSVFTLQESTVRQIFE